jgi:DNA-binding transcriptional LysR family regulator
VAVLDPRRLGVLREVAVHGGITHAAHALQVSPANVSQQINRLERDAGITLLEKVGRGVQLSSSAEGLVRHAEKILAILEQAQSEVDAAKNLTTATVRIASFQTFAAGVLPLMVHNMSRQYPAIEIVFSQREPDVAVSELLARRVDLVVADEYPGISLPPAEGIIRRELGVEAVEVHVGSPASQPAEAIWALEPEGTDARLFAEQACRAAGFEPRVGFESPDPSLHRKLVDFGVAAAFLPSTVASGTTDKTRVTGVFPEGLSRRLVALFRRGTEQNPALQAALSAVEHAAHEAL